jgi:hypothetical protein
MTGVILPTTQRMRFVFPRCDGDAIGQQIVFQVLPHTLNLGPAICRVLAKCHEVRNLGGVRSTLEVDVRLMIDQIQSTQQLADQLTKIANSQF